jgi:hypothetical protein
LNYCTANSKKFGESARESTREIAGNTTKILKEINVVKDI